MSKLFRTITLLVIMTFSASAFAQSVEVTGTVTDEAGPLVGATVIVKGSTTNAVITEVDGTYSIKVNPGDVLVYSYIGYNDEERKVTQNAVIDVTMSADVAMLEQVVVLGYGAQSRKQDLSASVGVVASPEQLAQRPVTSTQSMLQGQVPGVAISSDGGSPTSTPNVVIRGQGSQNGDNVLWVVDGIPGAPINSVNDIESIVVLKDAASAAIYGAQSGAGGVILVTTKKGTKGISLSYDGLVGVRQAAKTIQSLNADEERLMRQISNANAGSTIEQGWDPAVNPYIATTRTNWVDEIFRTALYHRHNVVINAGTDKLKNRLAFSAESNDGVLQGTYAKNMGIQYRGEYQINQWIKISEDLTWNQKDSRGTDTNSGHTGAIVSAIYMPQSAAKYYYTGEGFGGVTTEDPAYIKKYGSNFANIHGDVVNPLRTLTGDNRYNRDNQLFTTTSLELGNFEKVKGLKFVSRFTFFVTNGFLKNFEPKRTEVGKPSLNNTLNYKTYRNQGWKTENTLTYDRTFGKHTVGALLSTTANREDQRGFAAEASGFVDESEILQYFNFSSTYKKPTDYLTGPDANLAFIARLAYSYDDRYFVTASWRRDYAGRLPDDNNYGDFPAATAAWKISSEKFFGKNVVSLLKLRASWGRIGNLGSVPWNYKSNTLNEAGWTGQSAQYGLETGAGYVGKFYYYGKALNNNLTWETSEQTDIGLDLNFLNDRLTFSADFYNKRTYNLIQNQKSGWTQSIGLDPMKVNMGEIMNRGVELALGWSDRVGNWSYYVNGNAAYNKNWISDIGTVDADGNKGVWVGGGGYRDLAYIYQDCEGGPLGQYYMINCLGIFQSDEEAENYKDKNGNRIQPNAQAGDLKFEDANGDGKIDDKDRQYQGNAVPDWTYSLNAGFTWKDLSFSMQWYGVQGAQAAYMGKYTTLFDVQGNFNRARDILNAWSPTNTGSNIPRLSRNDPNGNATTISTWYLEDASYLRLKNVTIGYDFTRLIRKSSHLMDRGSSLMLYLSGENLLTITKYSGMDPECGGYDALKYPVNRILSVGIKLTY